MREIKFRAYLKEDFDYEVEGMEHLNKYLEKGCYNVTGLHFWEGEINKHKY